MADISAFTEILSNSPLLPTEVLRKGFEFALLITESLNKREEFVDSLHVFQAFQEILKGVDLLFNVWSLVYSALFVVLAAIITKYLQLKGLWQIHKEIQELDMTMGQLVGKTAREGKHIVK